MEAGEFRLHRGLPKHVIVLRARLKVALSCERVRNHMLELPRAGRFVVLYRCRLSKVLGAREDAFQ